MMQSNYPIHEGIDIISDAITNNSIDLYLCITRILNMSLLLLISQNTVHLNLIQTINRYCLILVQV
jgi:hypothetical protein